MLSKNSLRKIYLSKRLELTASEVEAKSRQIAKRFFLFNDIVDKKNFLIYLPVNNEVDTKFIINKLTAQNKNLYCPYFSKTDNVYYFTKFTNWKDLEKGPFGIMQPKKYEGVDVQLIEVAIIPGLAFSKDGVRLGYGKGVFDKLLSSANVLRIGLAYNFQVIGRLPKEKQDIVMDIVVTETKIYKF